MERTSAFLMERIPNFNRERLAQSIEDHGFEEDSDWWFTETAKVIIDCFDPSTATSILEEIVVGLTVWDNRFDLPEEIVEEYKEILKSFGILGERG